MRVGIQTWGTEGDVRPFFALGAALQARGHDVRVVYTNVEGREFSALARDCGVSAEGVGRDYFVANADRIAEGAGENFGRGNPMKQMESILGQTLDPVVEPMLEAAHALARESDVVIAHFLTYPATSAAVAHGKPLVAVAMQPVLPTKHHPPIGAPSLGRLLNPLLWWAVRSAMNSVIRDRVNVVRGRCGLAPLVDVQRQALDEVAAALFAISPTLFPRPDDWDRRAQVTGFLGMPSGAEPWAPDAALQTFLDAGAPPLFLTFGSMLNLDLVRGAEALRVFAGALARAGARGVVQAPAALIERAPGGDHVRYLERAPHARIFGRCAAIVHHGGAGTTQSALLAGRPSIIVPHVTDQFWFGAQLHARGVASAPLKRPRLDEARLAARIRAVLAEPAMTTRAEALGAAIRAEDGATYACQAIEALAGARPS